MEKREICKKLQQIVQESNAIAESEKREILCYLMDKEWSELIMEKSKATGKKVAELEEEETKLFYKLKNLKGGIDNADKSK